MNDLRDLLNSSDEEGRVPPLLKIPDSHIKRLALFVTVLGSFITPFMLSSINIALPQIAAELKLDAVDINWIPTAFLLATSMFLLPFGQLADRWGRIRLNRAGMGLFTLSSLALGFASSFPAILAGRVAQGIGCAMVFATGPAIISSVFGPGERGRALGFTVASVYFGLSAGPFIGGFLTHTFGWRSIFFAGVPLGLVSLYILHFRFPHEWRVPDAPPFDVTGAVLFALSLAGGMLALPHLATLRGQGILAGAVFFGGLFFWWEQRIAHPLLDIRLFLENRAFALANLAALIHYSATYATSFLLSLFLQDIGSHTPQAAGQILMAQTLAQAIFSPMAGRLSDRFDPRLIASFGMGLTAACLFFLSTMTSGVSLASLIGVLGIMGFGFALFSSPNINSIMNSVAPHQYGVAGGIQGTMRVLGQMLSMAMTLLISLHLAGATPPLSHGEQVQSLVQLAFSLFGVLCVGGIACSLARGRRLPSAGQNQTP
jgi:EmrB/QacA subfamily drug resistance transporter